MKKVLKITDIDCGHCAANIEKGVSKLEGVDYVSVSFLTQKMIIEFSDDLDFETLLAQIKKVVKKVDKDYEVLE